MTEAAENQGKTIFHKIWSVLFFLLVLYLFFFCIELIGGAFEIFGKESAKDLLQVTNNPIVGLLIGLLSTALMQSSSSTTSIVVGMVAAGTLSIENAVPIIMGANIGTTITCAIVSLGHVSRRREFERAFSGATVHDFFNICTVIIFLPIEVFFHPIQRAAQIIADSLIDVQGTNFDSPLKQIVKPLVDFCAGTGQKLVDNPKILSVILLVMALGVLIFTLSMMVRIMKGAMAERLEIIVDKYLFTGTFRGLFIGIIVTAFVQSSSVTTSLVIPLLAAGIVRLEAVFPYMVGANIGTTVTAILASLVTGSPAAVTIAFCHFVFNIFGAMVFLPLRIVPISLAKLLGKYSSERRWIAVIYVIVVFFGIPGALIIIF